MSAFLNQIKSHRSVRKFKDTPIQDEILEAILDASIATSSSGNMQAYSIILTKDPELKAELLAPHMNQKMVVEAPLLATFCADFHRMRKWLKLSGARDQFDNFMSFMIAAIDAILVSQTFALSCESMGLGICYLGSTLANTHQISNILKCPANVVPVVGMVVGYPDEKPETRNRLPLSGLIHQNYYQDPLDEEILSIYQRREKEGFERYQKDPTLRKLIDENDIKNLAQIYSQLKYTKESHQEFSENVMSRLKEAQFL